MNIRKAALALATASSVALAGTAVAGAETSGSSAQGGNTAATQGVTGSYKIGKVLGAGDENNAAQIWGSAKGEKLTGWGVLLWTGLAAGIAGTVASAIIGFGNYLKHQGIIK